MTEKMPQNQTWKEAAKNTALGLGALLATSLAPMTTSSAHGAERDQGGTKIEAATQAENPAEEKKLSFWDQFKKDQGVKLVKMNIKEGQEWMRNREYGEAVRAFSRAIKGDPNNQEALDFLKIAEKELNLKKANK